MTTVVPAAAAAASASKASCAGWAGGAGDAELFALLLAALGPVPAVDGPSVQAVEPGANAAAPLAALAPAAVPVVPALAPASPEPVAVAAPAAAPEVATAPLAAAPAPPALAPVAPAPAEPVAVAAVAADTVDVAAVVADHAPAPVPAKPAPAGPEPAAPDPTAPVPVPATPSPRISTGPAPVEIQVVGRAVVEQVVHTVGAVRHHDGTYTLSMRLKPEALGVVHLDMEVRAGEVHLHVHAEEADTRALLHDTAPRLRAELEQSGLARATVDVSVDQSPRHHLPFQPPRPAAPAAEPGRTMTGDVGAPGPVVPQGLPGTSDPDRPLDLFV